MRDAHLTLNSAALLHNLAQVRRHAPQARILAMVKADAYGHGALPVAQRLDGQVDAMGVAFLEEALALRAAGIRTPLVLMEGVFSAAELAVAFAQELQLVVHQAEQVQLLQAYQGAGQCTVWLKIDSGMHRLGWQPAQVAAACQALQALPCVRTIILTTHFACADSSDPQRTLGQLQVFAEATGALRGCLHSLANSAAIFAYPDSHRDWVRPGIMLYGASPFAHRSAASLDLQPVMTLRSRLIAIQPVRAGEAVGYGDSWRTMRDTHIGIVAIGYGDGYPRHLPNGSPVLIAGQRLPRVGRVSMDMIMVDLGTQPLALGSDVVLWGEGLPADEIATLAGTISYELFCQVTARVRRVWC